MTRPGTSQRLHGLAEKIRDLVNDRGHEGFERQSWHRICAAMDNLEDASLALLGYQRSGLGRTVPSQYLRLFGALQAIFLQQDSIATLHGALLGPWKQPGPATAWAKARKLRNVVGGHPAERAGTVGRITLRSRKMLVAHWSDEDRDSRFEEVDFSALVEDYLREAAMILSACAESLALKGTEHGR
jgi:hypothetical protein